MFAQKCDITSERKAVTEFKWGSSMKHIEHQVLSNKRCKVADQESRSKGWAKKPDHY